MASTTGEILQVAGRVMERPKTFSEFIFGMFSEPDGNPSFSRALSFLVTIVLLLMFVIRFVKTGELPDGAEFLQAAAGANSAYLINRLGRMFTKPDAAPAKE